MKSLLKKCSFLIGLTLLIGCQKPSGSSADSEFEAQASVILTQFAREIAQARGFTPPAGGGARGNSRSFMGSSPFGQNNFMGPGMNNFTYPTDINQKWQECLNPSLNTPLTHEDYPSDGRSPYPVYPQYCRFQLQSGLFLWSWPTESLYGRNLRLSFQLPREWGVAWDPSV